MRGFAGVTNPYRSEMFPARSRNDRTLLPKHVRVHLRDEIAVAIGVCRELNAWIDALRLLLEQLAIRMP